MEGKVKMKIRTKTKIEIVKKASSILLAGAIAFSAVVTSQSPFTAVANAASSSLPAYVVEDGKSFETIDETVAYYEALFQDREISPTTYAVKINGERTIKRINFFDPETPLEVNGVAYIDIPENIAEIMRLFGDIRYTGEYSTGADMTVTLVDKDGTEFHASNHGISWANEFEKTGYTDLRTSYGKTIELAESSLGAPEKFPQYMDENGDFDYSGYQLKFEGTGTIHFVAILEENGMATEFDTSAYGVLGSDLDAEDVTINVDTTRDLSLDGVNKMEEDVYKRTHVNSGPVQMFENISGPITDDDIFFQSYDDWGFEPGRGAFHIRAAVDSSGLVEDANNPGYSDPTTMYELYAENEDMYNKMNTLFPSIQNDYIITLDGWPSWQWGDNGAMQLQTASPGYDYFEEAADTAGQVVKAMSDRMGEYGPEYIEVKNESTISGEWDFFNQADVTTDQAWDYLAEFHNLVADEVRAYNPDVLVGGPSSAFMYLEQGNFDEARYQLEFMDATKDHLDWYSHHFYENSGIYINDGSTNPDGFLAGRFEPVMDLLVGHMENTDNVKPIMITEAGSYNGLHSDLDYFESLTAFNGYFLRFMEYPEVIDMYVPYLYPIASWATGRNNNLYVYADPKNPTAAVEMTYLEAYVDMWKDFRGTYIPSDDVTADELTEDRVFTRATRYGDTVYLAVQNLDRAQLNLDLDLILDEGTVIESVTQKHYYLENAELVYENVYVDDINNVKMRVQEMAVFEIKLSEADDFESQLYRESDYSVEELVESGSDVDFTINVNSTHEDFTSSVDYIESATLRVNFGKEHSGLAGDIFVQLNGVRVGSRNVDFTNKSGDILTFVDFDINPALIQEGENIVTVTMQDGGMITNVKLMSYYSVASEAGVSTQEIADRLVEALALFENVHISTKGYGVPEGHYWVVQRDYDSYVNALENAAIKLKDNHATREEIDEVMSTLNLAIEMWENNINLVVPYVPNELEVIDFETATVPFSLNKDVATATVVSGAENPMGDDSALKFEVTTLNDDADNFQSKNSILTFTCEDEQGWDITNGFSLDVYSEVPTVRGIYLIAKDAEGRTATSWNYVTTLNGTTTISWTDFTPTSAWVTAFIPEGFDTRDVVSIAVSMREADMVKNDQTSGTVYIDNIKGINTSTVEINVEPALAPNLIDANGIDVPSYALYEDFEDMADVAYTYTTNPGTSVETAELNGSNALKFNAVNTGNWNTLDTLSFTAPADAPFDMSTYPMTMTLSNPTAYKLPIYINVKDTSGALTQFQVNLDAGATVDVSSETLYNANGGTADLTAIANISIYIVEPYLTGANFNPDVTEFVDLAFIIDNVKIEKEAEVVIPDPVAANFPVYTFEVDNQWINPALNDGNVTVATVDSVVTNSKALEVNVATLNTVADNYSSVLAWYAPNHKAIGTDNKLIATLHNPNEFDVQFRIALNDTVADKNYYFDVAAGQAITVEITDFEGIDENYIQYMQISLNDSLITASTTAKFIVDDMQVVHKDTVITQPTVTEPEEPVVDDNGDYAIKTSFEDGEYKEHLEAGNGATYETTTEGAVDGESALRITLPEELDTTWGKTNPIIFNAPADYVWDFSTADTALNFTLTNPTEYKIPFVINMTDADGNTTQHWFASNANSTATYTFQSNATQWSTNNGSDADAQRIAQVQIFATEATIAGQNPDAVLTNVNYIIDNVYGGTVSEVVPEEEIPVPPLAVAPTLDLTVAEISVPSSVIPKPERDELFVVSYNLVKGEYVGESEVNPFETTIVEENATFTVSSEEPVRQGYTFLGWATKKNDTENLIPAGTEITIEKDTTIFAVWTEAEQVTVTFNPNYSDLADYDAQNADFAPITANYLATVKLPKAIPTRVYSEFIGWSADPNAVVADENAVIYAPNSKLEDIAESVTLYAIWELKPTITYFDGYGSNTRYEGIEGLELHAVESGETIFVTKTIPTLEGHTFKGWGTEKNGGVVYNPGDKIKNFDQALKLYAQWSENPTIKYYIGYSNNAQYDIEGLLEHTVESGTTIKISDTKPTRDGYVFAGWGTEKFGGVVYSAGQKIKNVEGLIQLYAQWNENPTVSYRTGFGTNNFYDEKGLTDQTVKYGKNVTLSSVIPTRDGYVFLGWGTEKFGGVVYTAGEKIEDLTDSLMLHAQWGQNPTITYFMGYGTNAKFTTTGLTAHSVEYGADMTVSTVVPTRDGYTFKGWGIDTDSAIVYDGGEVISSATESVKLYAQWEEVKTEPTVREKITQVYNFVKNLFSYIPRFW